MQSCHGGKLRDNIKLSAITIWSNNYCISVFSATHLQNHVIFWSQKKWRHKNIERQCKTTINSHEVYTKNHNKQQYFWRISWIPKAHTAFDVVEGQREKTATMRVFNVETIESNDYDTFSDWHGPVFLFVYIYIFLYSYLLIMFVWIGCRREHISDVWSSTGYRFQFLLILGAATLEIRCHAVLPLTNPSGAHKSHL